MKTKRDWLFLGAMIFLSIYLGARRVVPWIEATYGEGAPSILAIGFILPMWFWLFSIIHWEKRNNKLLIIKRMGLFSTSIEPVDVGEKN